MGYRKRNIGKQGEDIAARYLIDNGYEMKDRNYRTRWGEIDIIAKKENKLFFIEVKTRSNALKGMPYEAVTTCKINHLKLAANYYLLKNNCKIYKLFLGVISIILDHEGGVKKLDFFENIGY